MKASGLGYRFGVRLISALLGVGATCAVGGGRPSAEAAFATDFDCPDAVAEETEAVARYRVSGCGRDAVYLGSSYRRGACASAPPPLLLAHA